MLRYGLSCGRLVASSLAAAGVLVLSKEKLQLAKISLFNLLRVISSHILWHEILSKKGNIT